MIRKAIGLLVTAAILALLVFTVLHHDRYSSMVWDRGSRSSSGPAPSEAVKVPAGETLPVREQLPAAAAQASDSLDVQP